MTGMLLDDIIPTYDAASRHAIWVAAPPACVYEVARNADLGRPWPVRLLMGMRALPAWLAAVLRGSRSTPDHTEARGRVGAATFTLIAEVPGEEFVLGIMGRFWIPTGGLVPATADTFRLPPPAGLAQGIWNFRVSPRANGTELSTETRVRCGDEATRRRFALYWRIIRSGSGLIRGSMLRHIRSTAQQRAA
jgi:hypothetical protein